MLPPASFAHEKDKIDRRWPAAVDTSKSARLNEFFDGDCRRRRHHPARRHVQRRDARADAAGPCRHLGPHLVPLYVLNVTYPLVDDEIVRFCKGKQAVLVVEEGQPDFIEQALRQSCARRDLPTRLLGKGVLPMAGEYTVAVLEEGVRGFIDACARLMLGNQPPLPDAAAVLDEPNRSGLWPKSSPPGRPGFCTGCPERPIFSAMKLVEQELGPHHVAADIGCHLFSILPPFNVGATTMGYGLGPASASALNVGEGKRAISFMGDGGFWHNGLNSSIGNAVYNKSDGVTVIVDNHYSAATGGQDLLSSRAVIAGATPGMHCRAVKGVGGRWVRQIDRTYDVARMRDTLREALTTASGPEGDRRLVECMLNRQRREKPLMQARKAGKRVVRPRFGVDPDVCTGDHACMRLSGCPSLSLKHTGDKLKDDPVAVVDNSCVGCGHCGEVANAAVLCPSFYRADIVENPELVWIAFLAPMRGAVIGACSAAVPLVGIWTPAPNMERPITIAVLAIGGQGGGVLVDWIVALAERQGWRAQSTSVPGVAQRTGATIYYVEMHPPRPGRDAGLFAHGRARRRRYRYCGRMDGGRAGDTARPGDAGQDDADRLDPPHLRGVGEEKPGDGMADSGAVTARPASPRAVRGVRHGSAGRTGRQRRFVRRCSARCAAPRSCRSPRRVRGDRRFGW